MAAQELIKEYFDYREGRLFWKKCRAPWIRPGDIAGCIRSDGYIDVGFKRKHYLLHQLIFLYHHGYIPKLIDHINQDHTDNRIENLRKANRTLNVYNTKRLWRHNTSGTRGVSWDNKQQKWSVRFKHNGKYEFHGYYKDIEQAKKKRLELERRYLHYD